MGRNGKARKQIKQIKEKFSKKDRVKSRGVNG